MSREKWFTAEYQGIKYPLYKVSSKGRVVQIKKGKRVPICLNTHERRSISLKRANFKSVSAALARVLYCTYNNEIIPKGMVVDHIDNNFCNDHMDNFQLLTNAENIVKYHDWKRSLRRFYPFKDWIRCGVTLRKNSLYKGRIVTLGRYPTREQSEKAQEIAKEIIRKYKIKNNDKIFIAIAKAIQEYRISLDIPIIERKSPSTSKIIHGRLLWDDKHKHVYTSRLMFS